MTKNVFGFLAILFFVFYLRRLSSQGGRARRYSSTHREGLYARTKPTTIWFYGYGPDGPTR